MPMANFHLFEVLPVRVDFEPGLDRPHEWVSRRGLVGQCHVQKNTDCQRQGFAADTQSGGIL